MSITGIFLFAEMSITSIFLCGNCLFTLTKISYILSYTISYTCLTVSSYCFSIYYFSLDYVLCKEILIFFCFVFFFCFFFFIFLLDTICYVGYSDCKCHPGSRRKDLIKKGLSVLPPFCPTFCLCGCFLGIVTLI